MTSVKHVVGIDTYNDYYEPQLKFDRAYFLKQHFNVDVLKVDVCDRIALDAILRQHK